MMSKVVVIPRPEGNLRISLEALEAIRQRLLEALKQQRPPSDYAHLAKEVENAKPLILENTAFIGGWQLIYRDGRLLLERQQMPRAPLMLFYTAPLEWRKGQWWVLSIDRIKVRGR